MAEGLRAGASTGTRLQRRPRIFYGWWIVLAGAAINVYGSGFWFYGFPIFFKALLVEFGWARATGAAIVSLSRLEGGLEGPFIGWLIDRYGPRRLAVIGATVFGIGLFLMSLVTDLSMGPFYVSALMVFFVLYAGVMAVGHNTGFGHACMAAVNAWFVKKRSRAFALYSLGAGGSGLTVFVVGLLISSFGWRAAALLGGVGTWLIIIPLALVLRRRPEDYGLLPDGEEPKERSETPPEERASEPMVAAATPGETERRGPRSMKVEWPEYDFSVKETLFTFAFWMLLLASAARAVTMTSIVVHEVAFLTDVGIPLTQASAALGGMVVISLIGRLSFGWAGDYVDYRYLLIVSYLMQALGIFLLDRVTSMSGVWLFVVVYGIAYGGAIPLYFAIVGEYFGRRNYATIRGLLQFFMMPTTVAGPMYAGFVFDLTGSYHIAFFSFVLSLLVGVVFVFLARRPRPPAHAMQQVSASSGDWS